MSDFCAADVVQTAFTLGFAVGVVVCGLLVFIACRVGKPR